jgi:hypothetical protein
MSADGSWIVGGMLGWKKSVHREYFFYINRPLVISTSTITTSRSPSDIIGARDVGSWLAQLVVWLYVHSTLIQKPI